MKITYDPWADAVSIYLGSPDRGIVDYADVDPDTILHFDSDKRIVELEILAASRRLDLDLLLPEITLLGEKEYKTWRKLQVALWRHKQTGQPIVTGVDEKAYIVCKIEDHAVTLLAEPSSAMVTIYEQDLDNPNIPSDQRLADTELSKVLWEMGDYHKGSP